MRFTATTTSSAPRSFRTTSGSARRTIRTLIERIGAITAREVAVTGIDWVFAPTVAVVRDDRWGRTYEGLLRGSGDRAQLCGPHGARPAGRGGHACVSRALGTSRRRRSTSSATAARATASIAATTAPPEQELLRIHAQGYISAIEAGVQTVMVSYNSWQGAKMHGQRYLLTDVLKGRMGFDGLVVSDWDGIDEVQGCSKDKCAQAVNAGIDLFMVPNDWKAFIANTVAQVRAGDIPESRIDDAVTRILRVKLRAGLFEKGRPSARAVANKRELLGAAEHRAVAREAVRKSLVLLKNENGLLPLRREDATCWWPVMAPTTSASSRAAGRSRGRAPETPMRISPVARRYSKGIRASVAAAGGTATLSVDGSSASKPDVAADRTAASRPDVTADGTAASKPDAAADGTAASKPDAAADGTAASKPDVAVVVFGENPYSEWHGDLRSLSLTTPYRPGETPAPEATELGGSCAPPTTTEQTSENAAPAASPATGRPALTAALDQPRSTSDVPTARATPRSAAATAALDQPSGTSDVPALGAATAAASTPAPAGAEQHHGSFSQSLALLRSLKARGIPTVAVFLTGRPLFITPELEASNAFVVAWLPGTEGAGIADVLFRKKSGSVNYDFSGKLSYSWPRASNDTHVNRGDANYAPLFPYGFGLTYASSAALSRR